MCGSIWNVLGPQWLLSGSMEASHQWLVDLLRYMANVLYGQPHNDPCRPTHKINDDPISAVIYLRGTPFLLKRQTQQQMYIWMDEKWMTGWKRKESRLWNDLVKVQTSAWLRWCWCLTFNSDQRSTKGLKCVRFRVLDRHFKEQTDQWQTDDVKPV